MSYFNHAPTTHLATFALAALAGLTAGRTGAGRSWPLTLVYAPPARRSTAGRIAADRRHRRHPLRRAEAQRAARALDADLMVAGASFFIYLLQFKFWVLATHLHIPALIAWPGAVAGGVAVWAGWNWLSQRAGRWLDALRPVALSPAAAATSS